MWGMRSRAIRIGCTATLFAAAALSQTPSDLDILSASIEELPPFVTTNVPDRIVVFRIRLQSAPICTASNPASYGFLIDSDNNAATGSTTVLPGLGADARITAECDPASGLFKSRVGLVTITTDPSTGIAEVDITTTVKKLPSLSFVWVAYAVKGTRFVWLPAAPDYGGWQTMELSEW